MKYFLRRDNNQDTAEKNRQGKKGPEVFVFFSRGPLITEQEKRNDQGTFFAQKSQAKTGCRKKNIIFEVKNKNKQSEKSDEKIRAAGNIIHRFG